jgi:predicted amidohydrolase YtcJ
MMSFAKFLMAALVGISAFGIAQDSELKTLVAGSKADVIYVHGNIYTGAPANTPFSSILREEAIAVLGDRIEAVGKNADIEKKFKGPQTKVVDLGGHFAMPGFNDAHLHLADAGVTKLNVDLTGVKSLDEFRERVLKRVGKAEPGEWILGGGWDESYADAVGFG